MANRTQRLDSKDIHEVAEWIGSMNIVDLHKLYVRQNVKGFHCIAIFHNGLSENE